MESAAKRKAASTAAPDSEGRPSKRQKAPGDVVPIGETVESTTAAGLRFLESLRIAKDKTGRPIATHFESLPDKDELPEYYHVIKLPIAIDTMEDKLLRGEYSKLAQLESDCKRLVNNAKIFNDKKSIIYEDAERLRKTASNWMTKNNPSYNIKGYTAVATPVPGEAVQVPGRPLPRPAITTPSPATPAPGSTERSSRRAAGTQPATPAPSKLRKSTSVAPVLQSGDSSFEGKTFQQAQEQIITELIDYVEPGSGLQIFLPFVNLPSRSLKDYYAIIKHPMSLTAVQKRVRGVVGRKEPTGITDLKSWNAFEEDVSMIWKNARDYNEDGSELYNLSLEFEDLFKQRLAAAKAKVEEPPQPKLRLNMSTAPRQPLKMKMRKSQGSDPNTPGPRGSATPGVVADQPTVLRQKPVHESVNGHRPSRPASAGKVHTPLAPANPFNGNPGANVPIAPAPLVKPKQPASPKVNGIKNDMQSPALTSIRPATSAPNAQMQTQQIQTPSVPLQTPHAVMPPPQRSLSRPESGSPRPNGAVGQQTGVYSQYHPPPNYYVPPTAPHFGTFRKTPLKSTSEALIPKVTLTTSPSLNLQKPFSLTIPAHKAKAIQSITINLPASHSHVQVVPYLPVALDGRPYRSFYTLNGKPYSETPRMVAMPGVNGTAPSYEGGKKKGEPLYDAKLVPGVNRIEIEVIAEKKGRPESKDPKEQVDIEKCIIFVNLMRAY